MFDKGVWKNFFPKEKDNYHKEVFKLHILYVAIGALLITGVTIAIVFLLPSMQEPSESITKRTSPTYNQSDSSLVIVFKGDSAIFLYNGAFGTENVVSAIGESACSLVGGAIGGAAGALGVAKGKFSIIDKLYLNLDSIIINYTSNSIGNNNNNINTINNCEGQNRNNPPKTKPTPRKKPTPLRKKHKPVITDRCKCCKCIPCNSNNPCLQDSTSYNKSDKAK